MNRLSRVPRVNLCPRTSKVSALRVAKRKPRPIPTYPAHLALKQRARLPIGFEHRELHRRRPAIDNQNMHQSPKITLHLAIGSLCKLTSQFATLACMGNRLLSLMLVLSSSILSAQSFTPVRELKNLSPTALAKLHTLETLNALPAGQWRLHVGDLPHGEAVSLDDSAWPIAVDRAKAPKDAVWLRREIEVPKTLNGYDLTGSRIWFQFRANANGPIPEIIYFNGRRVALGDDLEPIILFDPAKPGDKILVAVKLLHTEDDKTIVGASLRIEPISSATSTRPNPDDIRIQCITAANLLPALATPRPDLLPKVEAAVAAIDLNALSAGDQAAFDASLLKAQSILSELHPVLAQAKIDLAGNAHIDAAWLWPRTETIDVVKRTFTTALQLMNEYPDYTYTQSAAQYNEWMADKYPALNDQIRSASKKAAGRSSAACGSSPTSTSPAANPSSASSSSASATSRSSTASPPASAGTPTPSATTGSSPRSTSAPAWTTSSPRRCTGTTPTSFPSASSGGSRPTAARSSLTSPPTTSNDNVNPTRISADFAESAQRNPGTTEMLDLYGIGDHGGGPTRAMLDQADHWITAGTTGKDAVPTMRYGTAQTTSPTSKKTSTPTPPPGTTTASPRATPPHPPHPPEPSASPPGKTSSTSSTTAASSPRKPRINATCAPAK